MAAGVRAEVGMGPDVLLQHGGLLAADAAAGADIPAATAAADVGVLVVVRRLVAALQGARGGGGRRGGGGGVKVFLKKKRKYCDIGSKNILGLLSTKKKTLKQILLMFYGYKSRPRTRIGKDEHS